jgi:hypothetical protein
MVEKESGEKNCECVCHGSETAKKMDALGETLRQYNADKSADNRATYEAASEASDQALAEASENAQALAASAAVRLRR